MTALEFQEGKLYCFIPTKFIYMYVRINNEVNLPAPSTINEVLATDETNNFPLVTVIISMLII